MPDWLTETLRQFPALVLCWLAVTRVASYLGGRSAEELKRLREQQHASLQDMKVQQELVLEAIRSQHEKHLSDASSVWTDHLKSKDAEIGRLMQLFGTNPEGS